MNDWKPACFQLAQVFMKYLPCNVKKQKQPYFGEIPGIYLVEYCLFREKVILQLLEKNNNEEYNWIRMFCNMPQLLGYWLASLIFR
jgi:hypothetical protein